MKNIEEIAAKVHNAWLAEKMKQGFHSPLCCPNAHWTYASGEEAKERRFEKRCDKCHPDMYPYGELPEHIKDYDRVTVKSVLDAIHLTGLEKFRSIIARRLKHIWVNDKTIYDYSGKMALNRFGNDAMQGTRWLTPAEIAQDTLKEMGYNHPSEVEE